MKYILPTALMLFSIAVLATGGGAQSKMTKQSSKAMSEVQEEESIDDPYKMNTSRGTGSQSTEGNDVIQSQDEEHKSDHSDTHLKTDDE
jgi:hypothetical protein